MNIEQVSNHFAKEAFEYDGVNLSEPMAKMMKSGSILT